MPIILRSQVDPEIRRAYDTQYRAELRRSLLNPGLSEAQRAQIREQLKVLSSERQKLPSTEERKS